MYRERLKSIVWFWVFKSVQTLVAGTTGSGSHAAAVGRPRNLLDNIRFGRHDDGNNNDNDDKSLSSLFGVWGSFRDIFGHESDSSNQIQSHSFDRKHESQYTRLGRFPVQSRPPQRRQPQQQAKLSVSSLSLDDSLQSENPSMKIVDDNHQQLSDVNFYTNNDVIHLAVKSSKKFSNKDGKVQYDPPVSSRRRKYDNDRSHSNIGSETIARSRGVPAVGNGIDTDDVTDVRPVVAIRKRKRRRPQQQQQDPRSTEAEHSSSSATDGDDALLTQQWTQPIIPTSIVFDDVDGNDRTSHELLFSSNAIDSLAITGFEMATQEKNDWIDWKIHDSSRKLLEKEEDNDEMAVLQKGEVLVYIGTAKCDGHGSHLPIIKTKSILPMSSQEMAELLMDSSRVKIYNKMSVGRTDLRVLDSNSGGDDRNDQSHSTTDSSTKVVCNLTQPPIAKSQMVSCTLMHCRKLLDGADIKSHLVTSSSSSQSTTTASTAGTTHLVVSRAVPGMLVETNDPTLLELPRNDILLGVNLLQDIGPNQCLMTAVTHVYSPALPTMLAKGMGVKSAINFVKDIRNACLPSKE